MMEVFGHPAVLRYQCAWCNAKRRHAATDDYILLDKRYRGILQNQCGADVRSLRERADDMQISFVWIGGLVVGSLEAETGYRS